MGQRKERGEAVLLKIGALAMAVRKNADGKEIYF